MTLCDDDDDPSQHNSKPDQKQPSLNYPQATYLQTMSLFGGNKKPKALSKADVTSGLARTKYEVHYKHLLPELQSRFPEGEDPAELFRVLSEWEGDVDVAEKKYRATQEWKKTHLPVPRERVLRSLQTGKFFFHGFDKVGRPIAYFRTALHDPKKFSPAETVDMIVYKTEELLQQIRTNPKYAQVEEVLVLLDRSNSSISNSDVEFLKQFYQIFKDHYPSRAEVFVIYHVNMVFRGIWSMVKPFLDVKSQGRTHMANTKDDLLEFIDEDQLADFLGGKNHFEFVLEGEEESKVEEEAS